MTPGVCGFSQLSNIMNTEQLFYTCIFPFIAFFGAFAYILYPLRDTLHPTRALPPLCSSFCVFANMGLPSCTASLEIL